jgi:hypothetical protein
MKPSVKLRAYAYALNINRARRDLLFSQADELVTVFAENSDIEVLARAIVDRSNSAAEAKLICHGVDEVLRRQFGSPYRARAMIFMLLSGRCAEIVAATRHRRSIPEDESGRVAATEPSADQLCDSLVTKVVLDLQEITDLPFGEESGLINLWEEICVQRQGDESEAWFVYEETVRVLTEAHLEDLSASDHKTIWLETDQGIDWKCEEESEKGFDAPVSLTDIAAYIAGQYVYRRADTFSNSRIASFLRSSNTAEEL